MAGPCGWCGGELGKYKNFYKGKVFCSQDHYTYYRRHENPESGGELEPHEYATKDSRKPKEVVEEVEKAAQTSLDW